MKVLIVGEGLLAEHAYDRLSEEYEVIREKDTGAGIKAHPDLALVLQDAWEPAAHKKADELFRAAGIPWLRAFISFGEGFIGPLVRPGVPGCSQCADHRHFMAGHDRREMRELRRHIHDSGGTQSDAAASSNGILQLAELTVAEARKVLNGNQSSLQEHVILIHMRTLAVSRHFFLADPLCEICGELRNDSPEGARISLQPSPKVSPGSFRSRSIDELAKALPRDYLDQRMGFLNNKMFDFVPPFADVSVNLPLLIGDEGAAGRTNSYALSELTAILEGLERYCGLEPRGKRTVIHDSYSNLKDQALNPASVGVHATENYGLQGFPFRPFDPDRCMNWVWGYSFIQEKPILVPELLAYYSLGCGEGFVYETSNGCALGGSLEESILYGIMEVVERDSFLLTWYAKLALPRLDPNSADDTELQLMIERAKAAAGYDIHLYNATLENGIPSIWALAKNRKKKGMHIICAGGAHPDPIRATKSAIHELAGMMLTLDGKFEKNKHKYEKMLDDPWLVRVMDDHGMLFGLPQAEERLHFLLDEDRPMRTFAEEFKKKAKHADLTDDLNDILKEFKRLQLDVIVVDQTTPEIRRNGLHCVKVLIPGMLPMTFGYHLTRVTGLDRVLKVPNELNYTDRVLTPDQLNPDPHPFP